MKYRDAAARLDAILDRVTGHGFLTVGELTQAIGVSNMTIRRDLARLEASGKVRLVHGGVSAAASGENSFLHRRRLNWDAKTAIAQAAAGLIGPEETIAIDAGSTAQRLLESLGAGFTGTIVTHSVPVITGALAAGRFRVIALGGDLLPDSAAFAGPLSVEAASRLRVRSFFLGAAAIDERGVYVAADAERPTKLALMAIADRTILLADHSKFDISAPVLLCDLRAIDSLVTEAPAPRRVAKSLEANGVRVVLPAAND